MDKKYEWGAILVALVLALTSILYSVTGGSQGPMGPIGPTGMQGVQGSAPAHEWDGTNLRFVNWSGSWGPWINLKGDPGPKGARGNPPAHEWDGTSLRFRSWSGEWGEWVDLQGIPGKDLAVESKLTTCQLYTNELLVSRNTPVWLIGTGFPKAPQLFFKDFKGKNTHIGLGTLEANGTFMKKFTVPITAATGLGFFIAYTDGTGEVTYTTWPLIVDP